MRLIWVISEMHDIAPPSWVHIERAWESSELLNSKKWPCDNKSENVLHDLNSALIVLGITFFRLFETNPVICFLFYPPEHKIVLVVSCLCNSLLYRQSHHHNYLQSNKSISGSIELNHSHKFLNQSKVLVSTLTLTRFSNWLLIALLATESSFEETVKKLVKGFSVSLRCPRERFLAMNSGIPEDVWKFLENPPELYKTHWLKEP